MLLPAFLMSLSKFKATSRSSLWRRATCELNLQQRRELTCSTSGADGCDLTEINAENPVNVDNVVEGIDGYDFDSSVFLDEALDHEMSSDSEASGTYVFMMTTTLAGRGEILSQTMMNLIQVSRKMQVQTLRISWRNGLHRKL